MAIYEIDTGIHLSACPVRSFKGIGVHKRLFSAKSHSLKKVELFCYIDLEHLNTIRKRVASFHKYAGPRPAYFGAEKDNKNKGYSELFSKVIFFQNKNTPILIRAYKKNDKPHFKLEVTRDITLLTKKGKKSKLINNYKSRKGLDMLGTTSHLKRVIEKIVGDIPYETVTYRRRKGFAPIYLELHSFLTQYQSHLLDRLYQSWLPIILSSFGFCNSFSKDSLYYYVEEYIRDILVIIYRYKVDNSIQSFISDTS